MLKFKKLTEKDIKTIQKYTRDCNYHLCDYSVGVIFTWYLPYNPAYAVFDDTLILKYGEKESERFMLPIGKNVSGAITEIEKYITEKEEVLKFICVGEESLNFLNARYNGKLTSSFNRNYSDYIYDVEEMRTFSGKKFSGQRNHINSFKKNYPNYKYKKITAKDIGKIKDFLKKYDEQYPKKNKIEKKELEFTYKFLELTKKSDLFGGYIEVDGEVASISIGERRGEMLIIHVEKALLKYRGAYPLTYNEFVKNNAENGITLINRQDDSGDLGLRTSKTQYKPIKLENKNYVIVNSFMPKIKKPTLKGDRVVIDGIKKSDTESYYKLNTLKENNKWWGYDYKKDNKTPTVDYFYKVQLKDFKDLKNLCLAIRDKKSKIMMGEVVLYHFGFDNSVEIGIRLFKKYQNKGFGVESLKLITNYAKEVLGLNPIMKCYKQNEKSKKMILNSGYELCEETQKYFYFKKI